MRHRHTEQCILGQVSDSDARARWPREYRLTDAASVNMAEGDIRVRPSPGNEIDMAVTTSLSKDPSNQARWQVNWNTSIGDEEQGRHVQLICTPASPCPPARCLRNDGPFVASFPAPSELHQADLLACRFIVASTTFEFAEECILSGTLYKIVLWETERPNNLAMSTNSPQVSNMPWSLDLWPGGGGYFADARSNAWRPRQPCKFESAGQRHKLTRAG